MATTTDDWPPFGITALVTVGVVGSIIGLGWALPKIIPSIGTAVGLAAAIAGTGLSGAAMAPWWGPPIAVGLGAGGAAALYVFLVKTTREAAKDPFRWTLPLFGIGAGLLLDLAKDYSIHNEFLRILLTALLAFLVLVAGACFESERRLWKIVGLVLLLLPPMTVLSQNFALSSTGQAWTDVLAVPRSVWFRLVGFLSIGITMIVLRKLEDRSKRNLALQH